MSNIKSIGQGVRGLRLPKIRGFPLTLNVALTTVLRTNVLHCDVDHLYDRLVAALCISANLYIPKHTINFYKFWWSQELDVLKQNAIQSSTVWKNAGKPRGGVIYSLLSIKKISFCTKSVSVRRWLKLHITQMICMKLCYENQVRISGKLGSKFEYKTIRI